MKYKIKTVRISYHYTAFLLLCLLFFFLIGCQHREKRENYILVTLDTQRSDHLSCYNPNKAQTPNFDSIAEDGILFENCYSLIPVTLPSHGSLFFSQSPNQLKSYNNGHIIKEKRNRPSFVNVFRKKGYSTAAFVSLGVLKAKYGLDEGFDLYDDEFPEGDWYLTAEEVNQKAFSWLEDNQHKNFFLWVHYSDPHEPYYPPDSPPDLKIFLNDRLINECNLNKTTNHVKLKLKKGKNTLRFELVNNFIKNSFPLRAKFGMLTLKKLEEVKGIDVEFKEGWIFRKEDDSIFMEPEAVVNLSHLSEPKKLEFSLRGNILLPFDVMKENYMKDVEYMDKEFGKFLSKLESLGLKNKTHILVVGDHGESLGDYINYNGEPHFGHIFFLYDVYMKVPLVIYNPFSDKRGIRIEKPVSMLDIAPTLMDTLDFNGFPHFEGRSLNDLKEKEDYFIFQETHKPQAIRDKFALLQYPLHLMYTPDSGKYELYDLKEDPWERENIYDERRKDDGVVDMKRVLDERVRKVIKNKVEIQIDKDTEAMLKTLGYIK
ncbi:MAG: sulfatase [Acidobacteriota bacterium]